MPDRIPRWLGVAVILGTCISGVRLDAANVVLTYDHGADYLSPIAAYPATQVSIPYYDESGFRTKPLGDIDSSPPYRLALAGPQTGTLAENGTAHLSLLYDDSLEVHSLTGLIFDAISVDLAEYSMVYPVPRIITFEGILGDGSVVAASFTLDGIITGGSSAPDFQTFTFPETFRGLQILRSSTDLYSLDNLTLSVVPEPASAMLAGVAVLMSAGRRSRLPRTDRPAH
ncbi:hypothetical protein OVA24_11335 [Luteolibacter sp. SL250]|uniref:hypothetical protein n=1 Tax=Luteolibacter sp. SL250 TaxID=2995170 RepID=UPI002271DEC9|nr:hypothetical protein [Luteolibacter sp. SL250]WAC17836.1 hypothetical protein OVA24_11335 [Luteolibacter sp. SL250]